MFDFTQYKIRFRNIYYEPSKLHLVGYEHNDLAYDFIIAGLM